MEITRQIKVVKRRRWRRYFKYKHEGFREDSIVRLRNTECSASIGNVFYRRTGRSHSLGQFVRAIVWHVKDSGLNFAISGEPLESF